MNLISKTCSCPNPTYDENFLFIFINRPINNRISSPPSYINPFSLLPCKVSAYFSIYIFRCLGYTLTQTLSIICQGTFCSPCLQFKGPVLTMARMLKLALSLSLFMCLILSSYAQTCARYAFSSNRVFTSCSDLPVLNSFLHYNYDSSGKLEIAYRHTGITSSRWVAWAINPTSTGMVGSQALVAYQQTDGSMRVYTSPITQYQTQLAEGDLSFNVSELSATYANNEIIIFATLGLSNNGTTLNQVWQEGALSGNTPQMHATSGANVQSTGTLNLLSGEAGTTGGGSSRLRKQNVSERLL